MCWGISEISAMKNFSLFFTVFWFFRFLPLCRFLVFCISVFLLSAPDVFSKDHGVVGKTYSIAEPDALEEIKASAGNIKTDEMVRWAKEKALNLKPDDSVSLKQADKDRVFKVHMSYTLEFDIPDGKGGVLYPKGYSFNPLEYIVYPGVLVVIDGSVRQQVEWFKKSEYSQDAGVKLLITDGKYYELALKLQRPVFFLTYEIKEAFNLQAVPCVVFQSGNLMEVREFAVSGQKEK